MFRAKHKHCKHSFTDCMVAQAFYTHWCLSYCCYR